MTADPFGPLPTRSGTTFRLWAPVAKSVDLMLETTHPMTRGDAGWYSVTVPSAGDGTRYRFRIDGTTEVPDPASRFQPDDIAGPSAVVDHSRFQWRANDWRGRPWREATFVETHVGTFTREGTYRAMIEKLDDLVATGFTALELMPLADFTGKRNWGYDGVLWYAPDSAYGTPDDLKTLIDEAHLRGLMVFLDVVYNHFGPDGNYLGLYVPQFFTDEQTPWGSAINYELPEVRAFATENAAAWLRDYRFDGLRLDAVHAIVSKGEERVLHEISRAAGTLARETGRHIHLVLENDDNEATLLAPSHDPVNGLYRAQWNDDYHHAWHVLLTGEDKGYYSDYAPNPERFVARALGSGFAYQGEPSEHRGGETRGEPSGNLSPLAFVNFLQNHDQIGNRALGDRLEALAKPQAIEAALTILLVAPPVPMLFMGEEWGAKEPFPFFCDFTGDLADAIRKGRRKEFEAAYAKYGDDVPDPLDRATFDSATLDWSARAGEDARKRLALVTQLLALRRAQIVPHLDGSQSGDAAATDDGLLTAHWTLGDGTTLRLAANLSDSALVRDTAPAGTALWGGDDKDLKPWTVQWRIER